ncbi:hypothetical protein YYG_05172 [Plasmodium vinckei petteri]|uniref:Fam-c protein n=1 Tax=Plasmodium vinckei petteri TaxID=138298 RepID=W7A8Q8_PLAVN|nr:hypothetical protein YYG_05172 [Plasmodium vinckei petteri]
MNKFYIKNTLFLLIIFAYANNETLAAELDSSDASLKNALKLLIYMKNNNLITEPNPCMESLVKSILAQIASRNTTSNHVTPNKKHLDYIVADKEYINKYLDNLIPDKEYLDNLIPEKNDQGNYIIRKYI